MTAKTRKEIYAWLKERKAIYEKYAKELNAVQNELFPDIWMVPDGENMKRLTESELMNTDAAKSLISNYCYYTGAMDALYGFEILKA